LKKLLYFLFQLKMWLMTISLALMGLCGKHHVGKPSKCPRKQPKIGTKCKKKGSVCFYGEECCCGECYDSIRLECIGEKGNKEWMGMYLDSCLDAECCVCFKEYNPVCGVDGEQYANACAAECEGMEIDCEGVCPCKSNCFCPKNIDPVCGTNDVTYLNDCLMDCEGVEKACDGECSCEVDQCVCNKVWEPVCGVDGTTYPNGCTLDCAGVALDCEGECPCPCRCPFIYAPVCGVDGETYSNDCLAGCRNVTVACNPPCPCVDI